MIKKRGMTLIELIVAITLFIVVVTLAIGGFVSVSRMKTLMLDMKNSQQKARLIYETIYRFAKEADVVAVNGDGSIATFDYRDESKAITNSKVFTVNTVSPGANFLAYCNRETVAGVLKPCDATNTENLLLGSANTTYGISKIDNTAPYFTFNRTVPATLKIQMILSNVRVDATKDVPIRIVNTILLEGVK